MCVNCRLLPVHYLSIKEALMRASAEGETLKRADVRHMFRIEPVKAIRVFELLLANGWIKTADAGKGRRRQGRRRRRGRLIASPRRRGSHHVDV